MDTTFPMQDAAIECRGLTKQFPGRLAVSDLDLTIPRGATFGLLGPNGAGKTTTIQMVLGLLRPTAGESRVLGGSIRSKTIRQKVGFVPEKFQLPTYLSCREFLTRHAELARVPASQRQARVRNVLELTMLSERADDRLRGFSKGMQQRAMIAQALLAEPELLILDEPTSALDPHGRRDVRQLIQTLVGDGTTVVLNSHILRVRRRGRRPDGARQSRPRNAGASEGEFDHVEVKESKSEVRVTLYLRNASVHPEPDVASDGVCPIGLPWHVRVVPLSKPLGKRVVRDMACAKPCAVRRMDAVQREYFLSHLQS